MHIHGKASIIDSIISVNKQKIKLKAIRRKGKSYEKNIRKIAPVIFMSACLVLTACGGSDDKNGQEVTSKQGEATTLQESASENSTEETTGNVQKEEKSLDGFYNCVESVEPCVRIDFEVKETETGLKAVFYGQYTEYDVYEAGQVLYGDKTADNTYVFSGEDESYTVVWDGEDALTIEGTYFNGKYERGEKDGYGEDDYMIADIPHYEADVNVESGIEIDSTLAAIIRLQLGYEADKVLSYSDLDSITYISSSEEPVTSLKGISQLKNLQEISIGEGYITDISELAQLENIRFVGIYNCYVTEIPDLSECENLESLYLGGNMIEDVSPLADIKSLKYVDLNSNFITSIEPLKDVTHLEMLCIESNCIIDYDSIKDSQALIDAYNYGAQGSYEEALALENRAKEIVASFPEGLSDLETEITIYKYIIENMDYDDYDRPTKAFGYDGIVNGKGVCGDYAEAFALLANHAGIETYKCASEDHAWNIVKIDGTYYNCDALWDEDNTEWMYFNKSTGYMYGIPSHMYDVRKYKISDISMSVLEYCDYFGVQ